MIQNLHLNPNIRTFGELAFRVNNLESLNEYLIDLKVLNRKKLILFFKFCFILTLYFKEFQI